jgi:hypothetical protein
MEKCCGAEAVNSTSLLKKIRNKFLNFKPYPLSNRKGIGAASFSAPEQEQHQHDVTSKTRQNNQMGYHTYHSHEY